MKNGNISMVIRPCEAASACGFSLSTLWGRLNPNSCQYDPDFPRPFRLGSNRSRGAVGWLRSDIEAYLQMRAKQAGEGVVD